MWTSCKECIYFDECHEKENRDGCYFGMTEQEAAEEVTLYIKRYM